MTTTQTKESQADLTPQKALQLLKDGNARFVESQRADRSLLEQVKATATGQYPFAVVLSCIDSRVPAEIVLDQGIGDVFSARLAGNIVNGDVLGSMEFACKLAGSKLIVVMGHTSCGAVKGACDGAELGNLTGLLQKIEPAVATVRKEGDLPRDQLVQKVAELNVDNVIAEIRSKSAVLDQMISAGEIGIVGAMYSVETGAVEFGSLS
jgi:carbonic anhydrase